MSRPPNDTYTFLYRPSQHYPSVSPACVSKYSHPIPVFRVLHLVHLSITHVIPHVRQARRIILRPPPLRLIFRAVQIQRAGDKHIKRFAIADWIQFAVDVECDGGRAVVGRSEKAVHAIIGLVDQGRDLESLFVELRVRHV